MAQISKKFIKLGTGTDDVNARVVPANFTLPSNYTPGQVAAEGTTFISSHLKGIDTALGIAITSGDIGATSFSASDNSSNQTVTGFAFANGSVRSFRAQLSVVRGSTYAVYDLQGIQRASDWQMSSVFTGDDVGCTFTINASGQVLVTTTSTGSGATLKFRAEVLPV